MKRPVIILASCLVFGIALVVLLYALSDNQVRKHNSFMRVILKHPFEPIGGLNLELNSWYIAGASDDRLYLGNYTGPAHLLITNYQLTDTQQVTLKIKNGEKLKFRNLKLAVEPPYFYFMDGVIPRLVRGSVNEWLADSFMMDKASYFLDALPVGPSSFAIRTSSSITQELVLGKILPDTPYVKLDTTLLQKQIDGKFCTDGMLLYDKKSARIVYVYYYRNQYIVSDTSLNLLFRGNTIDTVSHAQLTAASVTSDKTYRVSSPPLSVNDASCVYNGLLFIKSPLLSKNESAEIFKEVSVIDVYDLDEGSYKFSFYVPKFNRKSLAEFKVFNNKLIIRYNERVETHELNPSYFPQPETSVNARPR